MSINYGNLVTNNKTPPRRGEADAKHRKGFILIAILIIAASLRLIGLSRGDTVNDEVFYGFRAIEMMDFDEAQMQTTPLEWFDPNIPFWAKLSFHDHPPLVFLIQNVSMKIFGENVFGFRLPSALLGIISVYLIFLIARRLFDENAGLAAAAIFAITLNNIYISRVGMQEAYVIFFMLLSIWLFLQALKKDKYLIWTGVALGFGLLAKYNVFIMAPIFLVYLAIFRRDLLVNKKLWIGTALALIIFSPVIYYNIKLYQSVGHFDFQFSYIFNQNPKEWQVEPGKEIGSLTYRVQSFIPRLIATNSWLFLGIFALAIIYCIVAAAKNFRKFFANKKYIFLLIYLVGIKGLLLVIGPSYRFLTMFTPVMILIAAGAIDDFYNKFLANRAGRQKIAAGGAVLFFSFEFFYSINNQIAYYPVGKEPWLSSKVRYENYNWGYNELGEFWEKELADKIPAVTFDMKYKFLEDIKEKALAKDIKNGGEYYPALIVYGENFDQGARLWVLDRLNIYHGWPVISLKTYFDYLQENGFDFYERSGFVEKYFILPGNFEPDMAARALMQGEPKIIYNKKGEEVFKIYKF